MARELENADPHILSSPNFVGGESIGKLLRMPLLLETYARSRSSTERRWRRTWHWPRGGRHVTRPWVGQREKLELIRQRLSDFRLPSFPSGAIPLPHY